MQRLIIDARQCNACFRDPPRTQLPSPSSIGRLESDSQERLFFAAGDIENAFYGMKMPAKWSPYFALPPVSPRLLREVGYLDPIPVDGLVCPCLVVLPMGWSWSLHICQAVLMQAIRESGFRPGEIVGDRAPAPRLGPNSARAVMGYVDNFGVLATSAEASKTGADKIRDTLAAKGLPVHAVELSDDVVAFLGLSIDLRQKQLSTKAERLVQLRESIRVALSAERATGRFLEILVGHCTWAGVFSARGVVHLLGRLCFHR